MNRKLAARAALMAAAFLSAGSAFAQEGFHLTLGVKAWANYWETGFPVDDRNNTGTNVIAASNDSPKVAAIPSVSMRWGRFVASVGYFVKTEYEFTAFTDYQNFTCAGCSATVVRVASTAERKELDANIGWFIHPQVAVTLGYKQVDQIYKTTFTAPGLIFPPSDPDKTKNTAVTLGILGSAPIGGGFALYGNVAAGPAKAEFVDSTSEKLEGYYHSSEFGFAYGFGGAAITLGYKVQVIDYETKGSLQQRIRDTTNGFIAGISYTF